MRATRPEVSEGADENNPEVGRNARLVRSPKPGRSNFGQGLNARKIPLLGPVRRICLPAASTFRQSPL